MSANTTGNTSGNGSTGANTAGSSTTTSSGGSTSSGGGNGGNGNGGNGGNGSSGGGGSGGNPSCTNDQTVHTGQATWYVLNTPLVNCSYETSTLPAFYGAMNTADYANSAVCGACVEVHAPNTNQTITVQIVDQCPVATNPICTAGHVDLNQPAFQQLDNLVTGVIPITWKYVPCTPTGNIAYRFKEGSNQYWTAVQIRNHRYPIKKVEYKMGNAPYTELVRTDYNYFLDEQGMGPGPYTLRVTDIHDQVIEDSNVPLTVAQIINGAAQFPPCSN
jgi:expansin (peptidoglycan-binding protein)